MGGFILNMSKCRSCGIEIEWHKSENDRWIPYDINGTCHFESCPDAKDWRKNYDNDDTVDYSRAGIPDCQRQLMDFGFSKLV